MAEPAPAWPGVFGRRRGGQGDAFRSLFAAAPEYTGTEDLDGLEVYVFEMNVDEVDAEVVSGIQGLYTLEKTMKVDPLTGSIVYQSQRDVRTLPNGDPLIDLQVEFTED